MLKGQAFILSILCMVISVQSGAQIGCHGVYQTKVKDTKTQLSVGERVILKIKGWGHNRVFGKVVAFDNEVIKVYVDFVESVPTVDSPSKVSENANVWVIKRSSLETGNANLVGTSNEPKLNQPVRLVRMEDRTVPYDAVKTVISLEHYGVVTDVVKDSYIIKDLDQGIDIYVPKNNILSSIPLRAQVIKNESAANVFAELKAPRQVTLVSREHGLIAGTYEPREKDLSGLVLVKVNKTIDGPYTKLFYFSYSDIVSGTILLMNP